MGFYRGPNIVRDSLLFHLDASSYRSYPVTGSTWYDLTPNGNDATIDGTTTFIDTLPKSFQTANNTGEYDFRNFDEIKLTDCTLSVWFKTNTVSSDQVLFSQGSFTTTEPMTVWVDASVAGGDVGTGNVETIDVVVYDGTTLHRISAPSNTIATDTIYCLDVVIKPSVNWLAIYVDGDEKVSNTKTWNGIGTGTTIFRVGGSASAGYGVDGNIYASKIYTRALTAEEILQNYNAQRERYGK